MELLEQIARNLQDGEDEKVAELTREAIAAKVAAKDILQQGLLAGMDVVGQKFKCHDVFLPDVLLAARAMNAGMEELKPLLADEDISSRGKVVLGTIQGDLHDIGKNLVGIMLGGAGFEVIDLGSDIPAVEFVDAAEKHSAEVIGMSALLTTTMTGMQEVTDLVRERGLADRVKTIVGGAPVSEEFARQIGADAYGYDASNAVDRVKELLGVE